MPETFQMSADLKELFRQFVRNGRCGTCADCPRNSEGVFPEFCQHTERYDHRIGFGVLSILYQEELRKSTEGPNWPRPGKFDSEANPISGPLIEEHDT